MNTLPKPLILERIVDAPVSLVWRSLTDITLLKQWLPFFPDFKPEVGFETRFLLGRDSKQQWMHICRVLDVETEKKITYTWQYEGYSGASHVTFELFPQGEQTKIVLTHTITEAFPEDNPHFALKNFESGWNYIIDGLKKFAQSQIGEAK